MRKKVDFLVIGSGIAGLSYALKVADKGSVCIVTKAEIDNTNTKWAQGGIATVLYKPDSTEKHIHDTLVCGAGKCDEKAVRIVVEEAEERLQELIKLGTRFDKTNEGRYHLAKEGGHSNHRILHHKDSTGAEIERALIAKVKQHPNIEVLEYHFAIDLLTQHQLGQDINLKTGNVDCYGAYVLDTKSNQVHTFLAKKTLMATGGSGVVYSTTTNPLIATGDGVAMAYRAKAKLSDLEFIQFHPTSLYNPGVYPSFLVSEAVRGFGGILRTSDGKEFMHKYDERKSLAPRDIVARSIDNEMKTRGDDFVYLDCTHLDRDSLKAHFPMIYDKCKEVGIDMFTDYIPVVPACHYQCGGIDVNLHGKTSINYLYAIGECARTGLHGANRLASNSLLEGIVYAHRAAESVIKNFQNVSFCNEIPDWNAEGTVYPEEMVLITQSIKEVQLIMSNYVGIVRSDLRLKRAFDRLNIIYKETEELFKRSTAIQKLCELRNMINVCHLIIQFAQNRKESVGLHFTLDYK
jgi:L-aspartate oxidase